MRTRRNKRWLLATSGAVALIIFSNVGRNRSAEARFGSNRQQIVIANLTYTGNASCAGSSCHSADQPAKVPSGSMIGDEFSIWNSGDPHSGAYESLEMDYESADGETKTASMAKNLTITDAAQSSRCLACHAMDVPPPQRGSKFRLANAVGCESCHGPAQNYLKPHAEENWTANQRKAIGSKGLFEQFGLVDTTHLEARSNTCVACHLRIDKALVDAGHPPLKYEQYLYNTIIYRFFKYYDDDPDNDEDESADLTHWDDPPGNQFSTRLWATGVAAAYQEAKEQLAAWGAKAGDGSEAAQLFAYYADVLEVIEKHLGTKSAADLAGAAVQDEQVVAITKALGAMAESAQTPVKRWGIVQALAALADIYNNGNDEAWDAYNNATDASETGGEEYLAAVKKLVGE